MTASQSVTRRYSIIDIPMETRRVNVCKAATTILKRSDRLTNPNQHLEINMLKKIIALAVAAAFGSVAYAQAPATTPAKPATATTAPAAVTPASKPELKVDEDFLKNQWQSGKRRSPYCRRKNYETGTNC